MPDSLYSQVPLPTADSIRLLEKCPKEMDSNGLSYLLKSYLLDEVPPYTALSYTWNTPFGDDERHRSHEQANKSYTIVCNGVTINVTQSLYEFLEAHTLLQMDNDGAKVRFWIDAVCIDQSNTAEKNTQVRRMDKVYTNAVETIIWLGPESQQDRQAPWLFSKYTSQLRALLGDNFPTGPSAFTLSISDLQEAGIESPVHYLEPFTYFFLRAWFSRAWIVQEVSLSSTVKVLCGRDFIEWTDIVDLNFFINYNIISGGIKFEEKDMQTLLKQIPCFRYLVSIQILRMILHSTSGLSNFINDFVETYCAPEFLDTPRTQLMTLSFFLMNQLRKFDCWDQRDKIYASIGLISAACSVIGGDVSNIVSVDYGQPKQHAFISAVSTYLKVCPSLMPLYYVGNLEDRLLDELPTWVSNFSAQNRTRIVQFHKGYNASRWRGGPLSGGQVVGATLKVFAKSLGRITHTRMSNENLMDLQMYHGPSKLKRLLDTCLKLDPIYPNGQSRITALWRTVIMNTEWDNSTMPTDYPARNAVESAFRKWLLIELSSMLMLIEASKKGLDIDNETYQELVKDHSNLEIYSLKFEECLQSLEALRSSETTTLLPSLKEIKEFSASPAVASRLAGHFPSWTPSQDDASAAENPDTFSYNFHTTISSRRLFVLQKNLIGLGPEETQKRDEVWIFRDARLPFVLRRSSELEDTFQLVGDCYIHGAMNGEFVNLEPGEFHEITIE